MQFQPNRAQRALIAELDNALASVLPLARVHAAAQEDEAVWHALTELGLFGLAAPESAGGLGLGATEEALLCVALGRRLASPVVFATLGAVHARCEREFAPGARTSVAFRGAQGVVALVADGVSALLLRDGRKTALFSPPANLEVLDGNPWLDPLAHVQALGKATGTFDADALLRLRLIDAAALSGIAEATLAAAADYARLREQFGRPIGSFQAVKHNCANMAVAARAATDLVTFAALAIDQGREDAAFLTDSAFVTAARAATSNAGMNIQVHGAIGFSDEADPHLFLKRAELLTAIGGGVEAAIYRIAWMAIPQAA